MSARSSSGWAAAAPWAERRTSRYPSRPSSRWCAPRSRSSSRGPDMRVLIADDEATTRLVIRAVVAKLGHECLVAEDGDQAWAILQSEQVEVLITDWVMPGLDGLELCRRVRSRSTDRYTYTILATAMSQRADVLAGMEAGADDFLIKPIDPFAVQTRLIAAERVTALHNQLDGYRAQLESL